MLSIAACVTVLRGLRAIPERLRRPDRGTQSPAHCLRQTSKSLAAGVVDSTLIDFDVEVVMANPFVAKSCEGVLSIGKLALMDSWPVDQICSTGATSTVERCAPGLLAEAMKTVLAVSTGTSHLEGLEPTRQNVGHDHLSDRARASRSRPRWSRWSKRACSKNTSRAVFQGSGSVTCRFAAVPHQLVVPSRARRYAT